MEVWNMILISADFCEAVTKTYFPVDVGIFI